MDLEAIKSVIGVCDLLRLKPVCSTTETKQINEILLEASLAIIVPRKLITKVPIRLHGWADWSVTLLFTCIKSGAHIIQHIKKNGLTVL